MRTLVLTGNTLTLQDVLQVMKRQGVTVTISHEAMKRIQDAHTMIIKAVSEGKVIYGVTTGFGSMCDTCISPEQAGQLQVNLIRSHAIGTGNAVPTEIVRSMLLLRLNCIAKGHSGVSPANVAILLDALNKDVLPEVFEQGSVGASGDLCPLSHMILGLIGEGRIRNPRTGQHEDAASVLKEHNITPMVLGPKEGLALNNGTQFITSYLVWAYNLASSAQSHGIIAGALTLEMLHGTSKAYDTRITEVKPHPGQVDVTNELNKLLLHDGPSEIARKYAAKRVQEAYSLRCGPQIMGPVEDILMSVHKTLLVEINSANDNPLLFPGENNTVLSGGNFHGQYISIAADQLALAMATLANLSERRLERLVNGNINLHRQADGTMAKHLPSFLVEDAGLNSGTMILQYQVAALAAENRHLATPASVHTIPTCENCEDIVSMGGWAARKAYQSAQNCVRVVAAELYAGGLAAAFTPEKTTLPLQKILADMNVRRMDQDRYYKPELDRIVAMVESNVLSDHVSSDSH